MFSPNYSRNPLKELMLKTYGNYQGPDGCIDDHIVRKYLDVAEVGPELITWPGPEE